MYRDNTLLPKEAVRLAVLGTLALGRKNYAALASEVRQFIGYIAAPSLELLGPSIEVLRFEGLIEEQRPDDEDTPFALTDAGRAEFEQLMRAAIRVPMTDFNRLVLVLKLRFLHLLSADDQRDQVDMMIEASTIEQARLKELTARHGEEATSLPDWLAHETAEISTRLAWFEDLRARLPQSG